MGEVPLYSEQYRRGIGSFILTRSRKGGQSRAENPFVARYVDGRSPSSVFGNAKMQVSLLLLLILLLRMSAATSYCSAAYVLLSAVSLAMNDAESAIVVVTRRSRRVSLLSTGKAYPAPRHQRSPLSARPRDE